MARIFQFGGRWCRVPLCLAALLAALLPPLAFAVDWDSARGASLRVFAPGQMSWERTLAAESHKGATKIRAGESCAACHRDEEAAMGKSQAEFTGFAGRSSMEVELKAVTSDGMLHLRFSGPALGGEAPRLALMLGDDAFTSTAQAGCWAACHDDAPGMASDHGQALGKYLSRSRSRNTATGGGDSVRPQSEIDEALATGQFLEILEIYPTGKAARGYVLEQLHTHEVEGMASMRIENGRWIAELQRPLRAGGPGEIALETGKVYHFGIAVHDPGEKGRHHLVSLAHSLAIGAGNADVVALPQ